MLCLIPNWFPMLALKCTFQEIPLFQTPLYMPQSISHFHRFSAASSTFVHPIPHTGLLPSSASRALPKNPPLNINGRHSVQVQGIHANAPPGHPIDSNAPRMEKNSQVNCSTLANISGACTWYMMILQNVFISLSSPCDF